MARDPIPVSRSPVTKGDDVRSRILDHAVVVGGSMAGLLAAAVCSRHAARVTIVERDHLGDAVGPRRGVPQARMLHALLPRGLDLIAALLPGYRAGLEQQGAVPVSIPGDALLLQPPGWIDRRATGRTMLSASRPLLEAVARSRVQQLGRVRVLDSHDVTGLRTDRAGAVRGVEVHSRDGSDVQGFDADLVIDCAGRGSRTPA